MRYHRLLTLCLLLAISTGCGPAVATLTPELLAQRERLLLAEEPEGVLPVLAAREALLENETSADGAEVVVLGVIGGVANPWDPNRASFMITDPSVAAVEGDGHDCTDDGCAFCKKRAEGETHNLAYVHLVDQSGEVIPTSAQTLLSLEPNQMVVLKGRAQVDPLGNLVITAPALYIRR